MGSFIIGGGTDDAAPEPPKDNISVQGADAICRAARDGNELAVMDLIEKGANINSTGGGPLDFSPLMWASNEGNISLLGLLLNRGADPNLRNRRGSSALLLAAITGHLDVVRLLLDSGADLHFKTQGVSALSAAAAEGHLEVVRLLLERGARDHNGRAFEGASQIGHLEIMALLNPTRLLTGDYGS
ncbi:ankyrin repeat domain-containing protein [bacterium]|nr:MAG: ankyrin repeat domain-containing protein [bacterium]